MARRNHDEAHGRQMPPIAAELVDLRGLAGAKT
jgi:hypothetical protein